MTCKSLSLFPAIFLTAGAVPALAQSTPAPDASPTVPIVEVVVEARDYNSTTLESGRGWAYSVSLAEGGGCRIITPWHVVGELGLAEFPRDEIRVSGPGSRAGFDAEIEDSALVFPKEDVAVLKLIGRDACPFSPVEDATAKVVNGIIRTNRQGGVEAVEIPGEEKVRPNSDDYRTATIAGGAVDGENDLMSGWSGSTVVIAGKRRGIVTEIREDGSVIFITAGGLQILFGGRINLLDASTPADQAIERIRRRGMAFSAEGLASALRAPDEEMLTLFEEAGAATGLVATALGDVRSGEGDPAVDDYFTKAGPAEMAWFRRQLEAGLDPNLQVPSTRYGSEALLAPAIRAGNVEAVEALLEAGASPNPIHAIEGVRHQDPMLTGALDGLVENTSLTAAKKQRIAGLLAEAGAVMPSAAYHEPSGGLSGGVPADLEAPSERTLALTRSLGLPKDTVSANLCTVARPKLCEKASDTYGTDWCGFVETLPKGIAPGSNGTGSVGPVTLEYLLGFDRDAAYFSSRQGWYGTRIIKINRDRSSIEISDRKEGYNCRPRADGTTRGYCWQTERLVLREDGQTYGGGYNQSTIYRMFDHCEGVAAADRKREEEIVDLSWAEALDKAARPLTTAEIALQRFLVEPLTDDLVAEIAQDIVREDESAMRRLVSLASEEPEIAQRRIFWREARKSREGREAALDYFLRDTSRSRSDEIKQDYGGYVATFVTDPGRFSGRETRFIVDEIAPEVRSFLDAFRAHEREDYYIVTELPQLRYDLEAKAFVNGSNNSSELGVLRLGDVNARPYVLQRNAGQVIEEDDALPKEAGGRYLLKLSPLDDSLVDVARSASPLNKSGRLGWNFSEVRISDETTALALDRVVEMTQIPASPGEAERLLKVRTPGKSRGEGWRLVAVLTDAQGHRAEYTYQGRRETEEKTSFVLTASVREVLVVAPNNEVVRRLPARSLPSADDAVRLTSGKGPGSRADFPAELPLTDVTLDLLRARFEPETLTGEDLQRSFLARWQHEAEAEAPVGGRYFNPGTHGVAPEVLDEALPDYKAWLVATARNMPLTLLGGARFFAHQVEGLGTALTGSRYGCLQSMHTRDYLTAGQIESKMQQQHYLSQRQDRPDAEKPAMPDISISALRIPISTSHCVETKSRGASRNSSSFSLGGYRYTSIKPESRDLFFELEAPLDVSELIAEIEAGGEAPDTSPISLTVTGFERADADDPRLGERNRNPAYVFKARARLVPAADGETGAALPSGRR